MGGGGDGARGGVRAGAESGGEGNLPCHLESKPKSEPLEGGALEVGALEGGALEGGALEGGSLEGGSLEGGSLEGGALEGGALEGDNSPLTQQRSLIYAAPAAPDREAPSPASREVASREEASREVASASQCALAKETKGWRDEIDEMHDEIRRVHTELKALQRATCATSCGALTESRQQLQTLQATIKQHQAILALQARLSTHGRRVRALAGQDQSKALLLAEHGAQIAQRKLGLCQAEAVELKKALVSSVTKS